METTEPSGDAGAASGPRERSSLSQTWFQRRPKEVPVDFSNVFAAEQKLLTERRKELGFGVPLEQGLLGLSLSGGGIRSATFCLGVLQALGAERLERFDYLSTVSGGGFVGAALTSASRRVERKGKPQLDVPFSKPRAKDSAVVRHLRNNSSYLNPGRLLDGVRLPAIVVRGALLNLLVILPWLLAAVALTRLVYAVVYNADVFQYVEEFPLVLLGPFVLLLSVYPLIPRWQRRGWCSSERYERFFAGSLVLAVIGVALHFAAHALVWAIENHEEARASIGNVARVWLVAALLALLLFGVLGAVKSRFTGLARGLVLCVMGVLVPVALAGAYVYLCTEWIPTPVVKVERHQATLDAVAEASKSPEEAAQGVPLDDEMRAWLRSHGLRLPDARLRACQKGERNRTQWGILEGSCLVVEDAVTAEKEILVRWKDPRPGASDTPTYLALDQIPPVSLLAFAALDHSGDMEIWVVVVAASLVVFTIYLLTLDANDFSLHGFYRECLARVFVLTRVRRGARETVEARPDLLLSDVNPTVSGAPYPLINGTLNLCGATEVTLRDRKGAAFVFSPLYVGSEPTGYVPTKNMEAAAPGFSLASAVAVSAAAAGPNMGSFTSGWLAPLFTLLNLRLGYWLPHPKVVSGGSGAIQAAGARQMLREALGQVNERGAFVNVSDGGHFENSGAYELIRRKCRLIVLIDGEQDPRGQLGCLTTLMRLARIDFGTTILADVASFRAQLARGELRQPWLWAEIHYGGADGKQEIGHLLYVKAAVTGGEPDYVQTYRSQRPEFPHESTADQFFNEVQFESYRALGEHIGGLIGEEGTLDAWLDEILPKTQPSSTLAPDAVSA